MDVRLSISSRFQFLALSLGLLCLSCGKPAAQDPANMACVTRLQMPSYPAIAQSARVGGTINVAALLAHDGSAQAVTIEGVSETTAAGGAKALIGPELQRALKASRFDPSCGGKTVRLVFVYELSPDPVGHAWFGFPNRIEITGWQPPVDFGRGQ